MFRKQDSFDIFVRIRLIHRGSTLCNETLPQEQLDARNTHSQISLM